MAQLQDRIAIVTGGSRGIGKGIALELAKQGATVVVNYNSNGDAAKAVVSEIESNGGTAMAFQADVSNEAQVNALFKAVTSEYGKG